MEPNLKQVTVKKCSSLKEANKELVKGLLGNEPMSLQMLVIILESEPYNLRMSVILKALNQLSEEGLIKINGFTNSWINQTNVDIVLGIEEKP